MSEFKYEIKINDKGDREIHCVEVKKPEVKKPEEKKDELDNKHAFLEKDESQNKNPMLMKNVRRHRK